MHYQVVENFRKQYFKNLLTEDHLLTQQGERFFKKVLDINGDEEPMNEFKYVFQKDGKKYLLDSKFKKELPIGFSPNKCEKISSGGEAYYLVKDPFPAKFTPERRLSMRQLVDTLAGFKHTQPMQYNIDVMMSLTQVLSKAFFRKSSEPSFGKDSTIATLGSLSYKAMTIENPTIAKLELLATTKLLAINELNDITKGDWKMIEQFLLAVGAFKETYTKRSRATSGVSEIIDISDLSVAIMYNDIDCYDSPDAYFDTRATKQCKDRFPALRFYGGFDEDFNAVDSIDINDFVKEHWEDYVGIVRTLAYFSRGENLMKELKHFELKVKLSSSNRWNNSLNKLLRVVDLYCETQEEFDSYVAGIKSCMDDYDSMTRYTNSVQMLAVHFKLKAEDRKGLYRLSDLLNHFLSNTPEREKGTPKYERILSTLQKFIKEKSFFKLEKAIKAFIVESQSLNKTKTVADLKDAKW